MLEEVSSTFLNFPARILIFVPTFSSFTLLIIVRSETEAIEGKASPLNPKVEI